MNSINLAAASKLNKLSKLNKKNIDALKQQGCTCDNWNLVFINPESIPYIHQSHFTGKVQIHKLNPQRILTCQVEDTPHIIKRQPIIKNARLQNVILGNDCYVENASLQNISIANACWIEDVKHLAVSLLSSADKTQPTFGVGSEVKLLSKLPPHTINIFSDLTPPLAYLYVLGEQMNIYPSRKWLEEIFFQTIDKELSTQVHNPIIQSGAVIRHCGDIIDVYVDSNCHLSHCFFLTNGKIQTINPSPSIASSSILPTILRQVTARNFIIKGGSRLTDGVFLENVFIGEGVNIRKCASISPSLLFAASNISHSELEGVFAAPHTTSQHQATLLIAAYASHFNAGNAASASNHLYGLGPYHHAIFNRGVKLASNSSLIYPSQIGVFSTMLGSMHKQIDSTLFPFSLVIGKGSYADILPGKNLESIGLQRDLEKWTQRMPVIPLLTHSTEAYKNKSKTIITTQTLLHNELEHPYLLEQIYQALSLLENQSYPPNYFAPSQKKSIPKKLLIVVPLLSRLFKREKSFSNLRLTEKNRQRGLLYYRHFLRRCLIKQGSLLHHQTTPTIIKSLKKKIKDIQVFYQQQKASLQFFKSAKPHLWIDAAGFFLSKRQIAQSSSQIKSHDENAYHKLCEHLTNHDDRIEKNAFIAYLFQATFGKYPWEISSSRWQHLLREKEKLDRLYCKKLTNQIAAERRLAFWVKIGDPLALAKKLEKKIIDNSVEHQ